MVFGVGASNIEIVISAVDRFSATFKKMKLGLNGVRNGMLKAGVLGGVMAAGFGVAISKTIEFDSAMTKSTAIMGDLSDAMRNDMADAAREMAKVTTFSAKETADSYFFLASAGLDAEASIMALPKVAQFAQAGMFDMATATDLLTDAQSALGLTIRDDAIKNMENMAKVSDVLVKANTLANASVEQFSQSLTSEAGAALKSYNKDVEEGVAVLAAMADQGVKGQKAGTDLSRIMRLLSKAAIDNKDELKALGIEVFNEAGEMNNFADIIGNMEDAFSGMSDEQRAASLASVGFTARVQGVILPLMGTSDAIREYEKQLRLAGGTTKEVADEQLTSLESQLGLAKSAMEDMGITIGEQLAPLITDYLIPAIKWLTEWWDGLSEETQRVIVIVGVAVTAILLLAGAIGILMLVLSPVTLAILGIAIVIGIVIAAIIKWKDILLWILEVQLGIVTIMRVLWEKFKNTWEVIWTQISNFFIRIWNGIVDYGLSAINMLIDALEPFIQVFNRLANTEIGAKIGLKAIDVGALRSGIESAAGGLKGTEVDIGGLKARQEEEINNLWIKLAAETDTMLASVAEKIGLEKEPTVVNNINVEGSVITEDKLTELLDNNLSNALGNKLSL